MRIIQGRPPLYAEILKVFPLAANRHVIFAWGDTIYTQEPAGISPAIMAHEEVHGRRQGNDVEGWWRQYMADVEFRLGEELPAHQAEFLVRCEEARPRWTSERNMRRFIAHDVARRLCQPLYGFKLSIEAAKKIILEAH